MRAAALAFHTSSKVTVGLGPVTRRAGSLRPMVVALVLAAMPAALLATTDTFSRRLPGALSESEHA